MRVVRWVPEDGGNPWGLRDEGGRDGGRRGVVRGAGRIPVMREVGGGGSRGSGDPEGGGPYSCPPPLL